MPIRSTRSNTRKLSSASQLPPTNRSRAKSVSKVQAQPRVPVVGKRVSRGPDDGTPMIKCEICKDWFHFLCINLAEREAEEIQLYVCDSCHQKTGQTTVCEVLTEFPYDADEWEGLDAIEQVTEEVVVQDGVQTEAQQQRDGRATRLSVALVDDVDDEDDEDDTSGDDYKEDEQGEDVVIRRGKGTKRITSSDEEEADEDGGDSPGVSIRRAQLKRKRGKEAQIQRKRPKKPTSEIDDNDDIDSGIGGGKLRKKVAHKGNTKHDSSMDATRKYCLGKLRDVLLPIFVQFTKTVEVSSNNQPECVEQKLELDDAEKQKAEQSGVVYVQELEQCLFETYGEPDKQGHKTAGGKYKDRFRMLTYNLSQPDRHYLRRMIGTHSLPAIDLSKMSSVDLANEQTKQQIEAANRESLEHSILTQRPILARAKITHKGEEVIEDLEGDDIGGRLREDEERERERERERTKSVRERAMSLTSSSKRPAFQGPQDILAQQHTAASQIAAQAQAQRIASEKTSLPVPETPQEPAFKFDDLIAIDLPDSPSQGTSRLPDSITNADTSSPKDERPATEGLSQPDTITSTSPQPGSFDLSNVWTGVGSENTPQESSGSPIISVRTDGARDPGGIDLDLGTAAVDEDFDMFLDETEPAPNGPNTPLLSGPEIERAIFESLPVIWSGVIIMPDAGKSPAVYARQVGGRPIEPTSPQWSILFTQQLPNQLKIDGRVPVKESAKYMTQNRLNVTRELVAVALTPSADRTDYDDVISVLVNRNRHAVVLPWGPNPGPDAPGKELYLIPILPHEPLPDYVELLDLVKFPKKREEKMLLGVFILNKGKFSAPLLPNSPAASLPFNQPPVLAPAPVPAPAVPDPPPSQPGTSFPPDIISKLTSEQIESLFQTVMGGSGLSSIPTTQPAVPSSQPSSFPSFPVSLANLMPPQYPPAPVAPYTFPPPSQSTPQYPPPPPQVPPIPYSYPSPSHRCPLEGKITGQAHRMVTATVVRDEVNTTVHAGGVDLIMVVVRESMTDQEIQGGADEEGGGVHSLKSLGSKPNCLWHLGHLYIVCPFS
ncbi:hypothetical protein BU17DRAFT_70975 [Hysterangium stoloniferum]|nr:hypothetical protein BU17DRAFT_70975 [Hysterangium stoloniferum]